MAIPRAESRRQCRCRVHLSDKATENIVASRRDVLKNHDDNGDGFQICQQGTTQYAKPLGYKDKNYIFHGGLEALKEISAMHKGQDEEHVPMEGG